MDGTEDLASYRVESFTYKYHPVYGSPLVDMVSHDVKGVKVSADGLKARFIVDGLKQNYIHSISLDGVRDQENGGVLLHQTAYYTLTKIPQGQKLSMSEVSTKDSSIPVVEAVPVVEPKPTTTKTTQRAATTKTTPAAAPQQVVASAPTFKEVEGLLTKYTCIACHSVTAKQVGPPYAEIAKRGYTDEQMVQLMYSPQPANWPDYPAPMPPMAHVPKADALKIAAYINSLAK